jgi:hypothetical protein
MVPVVAAAATPQGPRGIDEAELAEFRSWRAQSQATAATRVAEAEPEGEEDWDDEEYELGAVAVPLGGGMQAESAGQAMAAAGTKAGAEKARVTRAAKKGEEVAFASQQAGGGAGPRVTRRVAPVA